jgi:hypothetical protein
MRDYSIAKYYSNHAEFISGGTSGRSEGRPQVDREFRSLVVAMVTNEAYICPVSNVKVEIVS